MSIPSSRRFRRGIIFGAVLAALASGQAAADVTGPITNNTDPGGTVIDGNDVTISGNISGGTASVDGLTVNGTSSLTSADASANATIDDGLINIAVDDGLGGLNGIGADAFGTVITGATSSIIVDEFGVGVIGDIEAVDSLTVYGQTSTNGLDNVGDLISDGLTLLTSADASANASIDDGLASIGVANTFGSNNGLLASATDTSITGGDDSGDTSLFVTQDGVEIVASDGTGNLAVNGTLGVTGPAYLDGGAVVTGDTFLQSTDGSAFGGVVDGYGSLLVENASATGYNGIEIDDSATYLSGGTGTTEVIIDDLGVSVLGGINAAGTSFLSSADASANASIDDGLAAIGVDNTFGSTNGLVTTAADASLTGGDDSGDTSLLVTQDGVEVVGSGTSAGDLMVQGQTTTNGIDNTGDLISNGSTWLSSTDASANASIDDGLAAVGVANTFGSTNGLVTTAADASLTGGDDTGDTSLLVSQDGVEIVASDGTGNLTVNGTLGVTGPAYLDGGAVVTGDTFLQSTDGSAFGGVVDGLIDFAVDNGAGGLNGFSADAFGTLISADNNAILVDDIGIAVSGDIEANDNLTVYGQTMTSGIDNTGDLISNGSTWLSSTDASANASIDDGLAAIGVANTFGSTNGLVTTAADASLTGGDDTGDTSLLVTQDGVEIVASDGTGNLTVNGTLGVTGPAYLDGGAVITGDTFLQSGDGSAFGGVVDGYGSLLVENASGTGYNGIEIDDSATYLSGGTGTTEVVIDDLGVSVSGGISATGASFLSSADASANASIDDGLAAIGVDNNFGTTNGLVTTATDASLTGGDDSGDTSLLVTQDGVEVTGSGTGTGNLSVGGDLQVAGSTQTSEITNTGHIATHTLRVDDWASIGSLSVDDDLTVFGQTTTNGITSTGDSYLVSGDGTSGVSVENGFVGVGTTNGDVESGVDIHDNTFDAGVWNNALDTGTGVLFEEDHAWIGYGNGTDPGSALAEFSDGSASFGVVNAGGNINGVEATTAQTVIRGGTNSTLVTLTDAGVTISDSSGTGGDLHVLGNTVTDGNLQVLGSTETHGITNTGTFTSTGNSTLQSTDGTARVSVADGAASLLVTGADGEDYGIAVTSAGTVLTGVGGDGDASLVVTDDEASLTVRNPSGGSNGVEINGDRTVISGGTGTTYLTLDNDGAHITGTGPSNGDLYVANDTSIGRNLAVGGDAAIQGDASVGGNLAVRGDANVSGDLNVDGKLQVAPGRAVDFGDNRLQGVGDGVAALDAVNVRQLDAVQDEARRGIAISNALETLLPDPGRKFRLNLGGGYFKGESALGVTGAGRINKDVAVYFGIGADTGFNETSGKIGISYQW